MRFNSRNLLLALALGTFAFTAAGFTPVAQAQTNPAMQNHHTQTYGSHHTQTYGKKATKTESVSGTIAKSGNSYTLRASSGQVYQLSNAGHAKAYVGKSVTVTGKVNTSTHMIAVQSIQPQ